MIPVANATQQESIAYIVTTFATCNAWTVGLYGLSLTSAGEKIQDLHPLSFIQHVFSDSKLRTQYCKIKGCCWNYLISGGPLSGGLADALAQRHENGEMDSKHARTLAKTIGVSEQLLVQRVEAKDWQGFFKALQSPTDQPNA